MFWRYSLLLGFIADLVGLWWDEVNKLSAAVHHQLSGIVRYSHIGKRFFNHFIDRRPRDRQIIVVARWRGHEGWAGQTFWRESKAGEEVQWVVNEKNTHSGGFVWRFKWCGRLSYSRSLKHCQRECILLNSNSGKESVCVCVCVTRKGGWEESLPFGWSVHADSPHPHIRAASAAVPVRVYNHDSTPIIHSQAVWIN